MAVAICCKIGAGHAYEPQITRSIRIYEKRDSGGKPKSLSLFKFCRRRGSNPESLTAIQVNWILFSFKKAANA